VRLGFGPDLSSTEECRPLVKPGQTWQEQFDRSMEREYLVVDAADRDTQRT
jgi:hypothetical protein